MAQYYSRIRDIAKKCEFTNEDEAVRDYLIKTMMNQPRTQALHCFYRDQRRLIIQARKGASSTRNEGSAWQKMQIFVVTYRISCF